MKFTWNKLSNNKSRANDDRLRLRPVMFSSISTNRAKKRIKRSLEGRKSTAKTLIAKREEEKPKSIKFQLSHLHSFAHRSEFYLRCLWNTLWFQTSKLDRIQREEIVWNSSHQLAGKSSQFSWFIVRMNMKRICCRTSVDGSGATATVAIFRMD